MEADPQYTIIAREQSFTLTKSQIEFDSPNFFTSCFLGTNSTEAQTRSAVVARDPALFPVIMDYLCGYEVLPLRPRFTVDVAEDVAIHNLLKDAEFFRLEGLVQTCSIFLPTLGTSSVARNRYILLGQRFEFKFFVLDFVHRVASPPLESFETRVDKRKFGRDIFPTLITPDLCQGFTGHRKLAAVEELSRSRMEEYHSEEWKLIGWKVSSPTGLLGWPWLDLLVVVEDRRVYATPSPRGSNAVSR